LPPNAGLQGVGAGHPRLCGEHSFSISRSAARIAPGRNRERPVIWSGICCFNPRPGSTPGVNSHKLKTPTTAISLFIQNLGQGIIDPTDPSFQETLPLVIEESQYLSYLIQDLLYYSEIILQEEPPRLAPVNPGELLVSVVGELQKDLQKKGLRLENSLLSNLPEMNLDRQRIIMALRALLENAIKFTPPGGAIGLSALLRKESVRLVVRDTGPGIAREELPKVFEKFYQVDPAHTGQVRGFGLGLYYARQFAQNHGGNIQLESAPGLGTVATLILPR
jgi:signal transduction histidine kinase